MAFALFALATGSASVDWPRRWAPPFRFVFAFVGFAELAFVLVGVAFEDGAFEDAVLTADVALTEDVALAEDVALTEDIALTEDVALAVDVLPEDTTLAEDSVLSEEPGFVDAALSEEVTLAVDKELAVFESDTFDFRSVFESPAFERIVFELVDWAWLGGDGMS